MNRVLRFLLATALAATLVVITWVAAVRFQAPAQKEAAAQPPVAQPVLADITRGDLTQQTTLNATAAPAKSVDTPLHLPGGLAVVTASEAAPRSLLANGQVVTWINDRPVIAFKGDFPLYRDLAEGDQGADVLLLQEALLDQGCSVTLDGHFGAGTANCLQQLYRNHGVTPATRTVDATGPSSADNPKSAPGKPDSAQRQDGGAADGRQGAKDSTGNQKPLTQLYLPLTEVVVVADLPAQIEKSPAVGAVLTAENATITLSKGGTLLNASIPGSVATKLSEGTKGIATLGTEQVPVRITSVSSRQGTTGAAGEQDHAQGGTGIAAGTETNAMSTITLVEDSGTFPPTWAGHQDILVTINLTEPLTGVLKVPQRAVASAADGTSSILVQTQAGAFEQVGVTPTSCVEGVCALAEPSSSPLIVEGAKVRVDR
ncbi:hypothetical protein [Actinomyces trachealis]|uniref:hypothetical protein n=1 Tax=Actinomyces trachealis TaxID=2763540 RepID=UPI001892CDD9|nr:hypothetical protein [Actinomyces trachealis]